ncbi:unnamed protein product [Miscanthus lutarioriparius]|uniref:Uncharacterized protein n=1 Tax=Miscanthus lutarioriparius TaxID=422564 RepID=A0A811R6Z4_9POAL|nr:unnamed protein product [Miscanthus lutarioriparius]
MPSSPSRGSGLLFFLAMVASLFTVVLSADSEWTWFDCQSSLTAASSSTNSTFWSNVVALLDALPSAAAPTGFASLSRGNGTDRAFVRGICRGDSTPAQCATYLQNAALGIRSRCNTTRRAAIWYDDGSTVTYPAPMFCFVSYADTNASTAYEDTYRQEMDNNFVVSNTAVLETAYSTLMSSLSGRVVNGSTTPSPAPMFATGAAVYDATAPNGTMYGLLQCMRDRTAAECAKCLNDSVQQLPSCCRGHRGGIVIGYNCYLRMEVYPYYDLALDGPPLLAPAPAPSTFAGVGRPGKKTFGTTLPVALAVGTVLAAVVVVGIFLYRRNKAKQKQNPQDNNSSKEEDTEYFVSEQLNLVVIRAATNNFSDENKLGEGGFGEVFKPRQRLQSSGNERGGSEAVGDAVTHDGDPVRRQQLDWSKRFAIICGIARGLLYLHVESRLKVIHRDLKPSNVLLDADMNPKISDFGIARAFQGDQSRDITRRPVGTLGYMSPEYAYWGHVSSKSDMFSFGVIVLEMVTGRRNNCAYDSEIDSVSVLSHVWEKWRTGSTADVVDPLLSESGYSESEVLNCIEIGLLCVQENPADRPDASAVVLMLSSPTSTSDDRRTPSRPAFAFSSGFTAAASGGPTAGSWSSDSVLIGDQQRSTAAVSENEMSISELQPR